MIGIFGSGQGFKHLRVQVRVCMKYLVGAAGTVGLSTLAPKKLTFANMVGLWNPEKLKGDLLSY